MNQPNNQPHPAELLRFQERTITILTPDTTTAINRYEAKGWTPVGLTQHDNNTTTITLRRQHHP